VGGRWVGYEKEEVEEEEGSRYKGEGSSWLKVRSACGLLPCTLQPFLARSLALLSLSLCHLTLFAFPKVHQRQESTF
jgi:hypothetical protein